MPQHELIPVSLIDPDPDQSRKKFEDIPELAENLTKVGQQVEVIVYRNGERFICPDGNRRLQAAALAGLADLRAYVLDKKPSKLELLVAQASIDGHRDSFKPTEKGRLYAQIQQEKRCSLSEVAALLNISQSLVSKLVAVSSKLDPTIQQMVDAGKLDGERAYLISTEPDYAKQRELATKAAGLSREQLRQKAKGRTQAVEPKSQSLRLAMIGGFSISLRGGELNLTTAIEVLTETVRKLKKSQSEGYDVTTVQKMFADTAKAGTKGATNVVR